MALFPECMVNYAPKGLDTADIVRDAIFRQVGTLMLFACHRREDGLLSGAASLTFVR